MVLLKTKFAIIIVIVFLINLPISFSLDSIEDFSNKETEEFTEEEKKWIEENPLVYLALEPQFAPVEFIDENGQYSGIAADFLKWIGEDTGLEFEIVTHETWQEALDDVRAKNTDLLGGVRKTQERMKYLLFTDDFFTVPTVLFTREDMENINSMEDVEDLKLGLIRGYAIGDFMGIQHPELDIVKVDNIEEGLKMLSITKEIDGFFSDVAHGGYYIEQFGIENLQVSFDVDFNYELGFAVRDDYTVLRDILDKSLKRMPEIRKREIISKWIYLQSDNFYFNEKFLYIGGGILLIAISIILIIGFINRTLKKQVEKQTRELKLLNESLEEKVKKRTQELQESNHKLEESISDLKTAQDKLLEVQKLAALGQLVKGVAHEINTPLGTAITVSTHIENICKTTNSKILNGKITKKEMSSSVNSFEKSIKMLHSNLDRVANIINDFKKIAVDDYHDEKSEFNVVKSLEMVLLGLKENYIDDKCQVTINSPEEILIESYQESFLEIFSNLIMNSCIHAFGDKTGNIKIAIEEFDDFIMIFYEDDGIGIEDSQKTKVFEPFYTTKRTSGGGGLGLFIVHNLVTKKLTGSISIDSMPGHGISFFIKIPK